MRTNQLVKLFSAGMVAFAIWTYAGFVWFDVSYQYTVVTMLSQVWGLVVLIGAVVITKAYGD